MGIASTPPRPYVTSHNSKGDNPIIHQVIEKANSMSQDYHHQSLFNFSNGFERSQAEQQQQQQQQHHMAQQIRRDKLRVQGFDPPSFEEEEASGLPVYHETAGMLSEMFNFPPGTVTTATTELLESQFNQNFRHPNQNPRSQSTATGMGGEWFGSRQGMIVGAASHQQVPLGYGKNHNNQISSAISVADSAAAMQLFLMNPPQPRSPSSPSPSSHHHHNNPPSTLHMLLPNPSSTSTLQGFPNPAEGSFGQFTTHLTTPNEIGGINVVESQGLSLSLSSSLQHLDATKESEMLFFNQGGSNSGQFRYKNLSIGGGGVTQNNLQQVHVGYGSSLGVVNVLRNSKYAKAAQELLEEFCSVGRGKFTTRISLFTHGQNGGNSVGKSSFPTENSRYRSGR